MDFIWFVLILAILFVPWGRVWDRLLGKEQDEENEQMDPNSSCDNDALLGTKIDCLKISAAILTNEGKHHPASVIAADAQTFWDFLLKTDEDTTDQ